MHACNRRKGGDKVNSVEYHVKCRDACQQLADAHNEEIERMKPPEVKFDEKDYDGLNWKTISGTKAEYEQTTKEANEGNEVFRVLQQMVKEHDGFMQTSTHKFWFHSGDENTIDRRRK